MTKGHTSVMASRKAVPKEAPPWAKLEFFPTPPWATRALLEDVLRLEISGTVWDPCAGLGHMSDVLGEYVADVIATDVYGYPMNRWAPPPHIAINHFDFLDRAALIESDNVDWIVTNPPFSKAVEIIANGLLKARSGVALLMRIQWLEGEARYRGIYEESGPTFVAPFSERVPMCEGGWDVEGSSATMYAWFVWLRCEGQWQFTRQGRMPLQLIPPGRCRIRSHDNDARVFGARHVPGWIAPSRLKKAGRDQIQMEF